MILSQMYLSLLYFLSAMFHSLLYQSLVHCVLHSIHYLIIVTYSLITYYLMLLHKLFNIFIFYLLIIT